MSVGTAKVQMLRIQGVIYLTGSVMLLGAHLRSGVMTGPNAAFSAALILPAILGMACGDRIGRRLDQARFRAWTQALLILTGLNLMRRALGF